ncbi:uncharacterized protein TNCV_2059041 [Trichonephila clavipes]|nr:uncharacterized protein TNCV_2059041 [Trichonephila clavipes]
MGDEQNEVNRHRQSIEGVERETVLKIQQMLHSHNVLLKIFKSATDNWPSDNYKVVIHADRSQRGEHEWRYKAPMVNEVAVLVTGEPCSPRDSITVHDNTLQRNPILIRAAVAQWLRETVHSDKGYPLYRRRAPVDGGKQVDIRTRSGEITNFDNSWVVPYSPILCKLFNAHINVEACNSVRGLNVFGSTPVENQPGVKASDALGRVYTVHVTNLECFCLRMLLQHVGGPTSFTKLKIVNGQECQTYREACEARRSLENDNHWEETMEEAEQCRSPDKIRELYTALLSSCGLFNP